MEVIVRARVLSFLGWMTSQGVQENHGGTIFVRLVVLHGVALCVSVGCKSFLYIYGWGNM